MSYSYDRRTAAMKRIEDLPEHVSVLIKGAKGGGFSARLVGEDMRMHQDPKAIIWVGPVGITCEGGAVVESSQASSGWGPLIYDIAMEYVYPKGLTADRSSVSGSAARVWSYYLKSRGDVVKKPIDDPDCASKLEGEHFGYTYHKKPALMRRHPDKILVK